MNHAFDAARNLPALSHRDREVRGGVVRNDVSSHQHTTQDESGLQYIDYLRASLDEFDDHYVDWLAFLQSHKDLVADGRDNSPNATVRRKYSWLRNYHNAVVDEALSELEPNATLEDGLRLDELLEAHRIQT